MTNRDCKKVSSIEKRSNLIGECEGLNPRDELNIAIIKAMNMVGITWEELAERSNLTRVE